MASYEDARDQVYRWYPSDRRRLDMFFEAAERGDWDRAGWSMVDLVSEKYTMDYAIVSEMLAAVALLKA